jgi:phosphoribosylamine--glycine ligase
MAAGGYPNDVNKGDIISGLDKTESDGLKTFHAGTKLIDGNVTTNGGRVLCVTALGDSVAEAQQRAHERIKEISWADEYHRSDIGYRAIAREKLI